MSDDLLRKMTGRKVLELRNKLRMSQRELGERAGVKQSMISQIERGVKAISIDLMPELARALGVDESVLTLEALAPKTRLGAPGSFGASDEDIQVWRTRILRDLDVSDGASVILALLASPPFLDGRSWIVFVTVEQFIRDTGRSRKYVEEHWPEAMESNYVELIGEVEWSFRLKFPD